MQKVFFFILLPLLSSGFLINLDANDERCFHERLKDGIKFTVMFEVAEGGFLDVDILVSLN
jgi:hypothetical protein